MMKAKMLIALLVPFLVASCDDTVRAPNSGVSGDTRIVGTVSMTGGDAEIYRWHDDDKNATCWIIRRLTNGGYSGISCVADAVLKMPKPSAPAVDGGWPEDGPARHVAGGPGA